MKSFEAIAQRAYEAFQQALPKDGKQVAAWEELKEASRTAWIAASRKMAEEIQQVL